MPYEQNCKCGKAVASFNFKDEMFTPDVISGLYCPECSKDIRINPDTMIIDNGWIIEYDMSIARFQSVKLAIAHESLTPEFIFDEGYCTWRGIYPTDHIDSLKEREDIIKLAKVDPKRYLREIKDWGNKRMKKLAEEGWRKASVEEIVK
jgi:hypothetical protein